MQKVEKDHGQYDSPQNVLWVSGSCLVVRSSVWKALGGLDERFFAHMEEIDLCWRMQLRGWKGTVVPASAVYHIGGGPLRNESPFKLFLNYRNNLLLLENNLPSTLHSRWKARLRIHVRMFLDGLSALVYLCKGQGTFFTAVVRAHRDYRKLRRPGELLPDAPAPDGLSRGWIVPVGLFRKK